MKHLAALGFVVALASPVGAHEPASTTPWAESDRWILAHTDDAKGEMTFVALGQITRAGSAAKIETLRVHRDVDERFGTDQAHYHLLVDCSDFSWTRISFRGFRPDGSAGPLITSDIGAREAPAEGNMFHHIFNLACDGRSAQGNTVTSPYAFAKSYFTG